ncbi:MAG: adenosylcobinamide-GDP ribazoletransferase [Candidatus Rokuibacteriota bacterium]
MQGLLVAARYLTIVPVRGPADVDGLALGRSAPWFPVVGLALGVALALTDRLTAWLFPALLGALLTVTVWKLLTGGLHLDGLADCLDGLVAGDPEHRLRVMRDSRIGAFGAVGLILFLLLEIAALAELASGLRWRVLLVVPVIGRAMPALLSLCFPAVPGGRGAAFGAGVQRRAVLVGLALAGAIAVAALGATGLIALVVACLASLVLGRFFTTRLGGITGDVLGATVEVAELAALLTASSWGHWGR